jgi:opacity protein-like surface antigen
MRTARLALTTVLIAASASSVWAQDGWTGLYGGAAVGNLESSAEDGSSDAQAIASLIAGYNMDMGPTFVIGLEGDLSSDTLNKNDFSYSLRPRAGYKVLNETGMAFATFGYSGTQIKGENPEGWTVGLGYEHQLTPLWHVRAEYLYSEQDLLGFGTEYQYLRAGLTSKF